MPAPHLTDSVEDFFDYDEYVSNSLSADPETKDLASIVEAGQEKLAKAAGTRTVAKRGVNRAVAFRDFAWRSFLLALAAFDRKAQAELPKGKADPRYKATFTKSVAELSRTAIDDRAEVLEPVVEAATSAEMPREIEKAGKALATAWKTYTAAAAAHEKAERVLARARDTIEEAKKSNIAALHKVEGKLTDRFSDDLPRVRSYFPPTKAKVSDEERAARLAAKAKKEEEKAAAAAAKAAKLAEKAKTVAAGKPGPVASGKAGAPKKEAKTPDAPIAPEGEERDEADA